MTDTDKIHPQRRAVIVLSMHRSGSSAITRALNLCGLDLPATLVDAGRDNVKGFWESRRIMEVNDQILTSAGLHWHELGEIPSDWWQSQDALEARSTLATALAEEYGEASLFVLKDPRFCHLVPLLEAALADIGVAPHYVLIFRNPIDVAASLRTRNGFSFSHSLLLWLRYVLSSEQATRGKRRVVVRYDELLGDCRAVLERIGTALDITWPVPLQEAVVSAEDFLGSDLRHHQTADSALAEASGVPTAVISTFSELQGQTKEPSLGTAALDEANRWLSQVEQGVAPLINELRRGNRELESRYAVLRDAHAVEVKENSERGHVIQGLENRSHNLEGQISALNTYVRELGEHTEKQQLQVGRLSQALENSTQEKHRIAQASEQATSELNGLQAERAQLQQTLEASQRERQVLASQLAGAWQEVTGLHASRSWRITLPLRMAFDMLETVKHRFNKPALGKITAAQEEHNPQEQAAPADTRATKGVTQAMPQTPEALYREKSQAELARFLQSSEVIALPSPKRPKISAILILYNHAELTYSCLRSLAASACQDFELIIVDNGSTDGTHALLEQISGAAVVKNNENLHFLKGVNQAAKQAQGEYLLILNNDTTLEAEAMDAALSVYAEQSQTGAQVGVVGGKVIHLGGTLQEAGSIVWKDGSCWGYGRGLGPDAAEVCFRRDVDYCSGVFMLTPRALFEQMGGLDEAYAPAYYEETDYCTRLVRDGYRIVYEPRCVIHHHEFGSSNQTSAGALMKRNQQFFRDRHGAYLNANKYKPSPENILLARSVAPRARRILVIDDKFPLLHLGQGFPRANRIVRELCDQGYEVTLFATNQPPMKAYDAHLDLPVSVECIAESPERPLRDFLRERQGFYATVLISRPHNMQRVQAVKSRDDSLKGMRIIYDAEAIFADREAAAARLRGKPLSEEKQQKIRAEELQLAQGVDAITMVSDNDASAFKEIVPQCHVLGHWIEPQPTPADFAAREGFLFVGAMPDDENPNADSVLWFHQQVWPLLSQKLGDSVGIKVAGLNYSQRVRELHNGTFEVLGEVTDLEALYARARVVIVPTRYAAGIPFKAHEAASRGVPMVTTDLIAQQLGWQHEEALLSAASEDPQAFAKACERLYNDAALWQQIREQALQRIQVECSPGRFAENLSAALGVAQS